MSTAKTAHEKALELAKASSPRYGIYLDGGDATALKDAMDITGALLLSVLNSDSEEKTKRQALAILIKATPSMDYTTITNCNITMEN